MTRLSSFCLTCIFSLLLSACVSQSDKIDFDRQQAAQARVELGLGYLAEGNFAQAKLNLDKALAYAPNYYLPHSALAYFYQRQEALEQANAAYLTALKLDENQGDVLNNYGAFLCSQGKYQEAYAQFDKALNSNGYYQQADTYENLAICAFKAKDQETLQANIHKLAQLNAARAQLLQSKLK